MSGETARNESGWTTDTLKEYVDQRFIDAKEAIHTANAANEKRFDAVNEFRGQLNDQVNTFLPRKEYDARHETLENRVSELTDRLNRTEGDNNRSEITKSDMFKYVAAAVSILGAIVLLANNVFSK